MSSIVGQRRFKRRLLVSISRRSATGGDQITTALLAREKRRFLTNHAVQSATLFDLRVRDLGESDARTLWSIEQSAPVVPRSYYRLPAVPIGWRPKQRRTSGVRKICALPTTLKMWHTLAKELLVAQHTPRAHIGDWSGRGRDQQIKQLWAAIQSDQQVVVVADVKQAFPSVQPDALYRLPYLPEALIRRAIDHRSLRFTGGYRSARPWNAPNGMHDDLEVAPRGLLEGSPVSNALFSVLLDDLPDHIGEGIMTFVYCDNIILVAQSRAHGLEAMHALTEYFAGHHAGPFEIRSEVRSVRDGFEHLGYSLYRHGDVSRIALAPPSWEKLHARLEDQTIPTGETTNWLGASFSALDPDATAAWHHAINQEALRRQRLGSAVLA